ncbi:MAG: glycosyl transferase family 1 [Deltaproteobacteria bacterium HGW-Deltaproteobacteria-19]|jgi:trehalose synthase|nr:MAG: glycosyl transferase family 1 [Deltaproteobacteria bacterium HGW-Deltaproteobacteria-19]
MIPTLDAYIPVVGNSVIDQLHRLGERLKGIRVVHVNSTREGGGVAEILNWMVPLMTELGLDARWEVIEGNNAFFGITKGIHNGLQGFPVVLKRQDWETYEEVNRQNLARLQPVLEDADIVVIHDPQPAALLGMMPNRRGRWIWRAHIDVSKPFRPIWQSLRSYLPGYDASIFSLTQFAQPLPHPQFIIPPSIDPLSEKNRELLQADLDTVAREYDIDRSRPVIVQVSRFDRFKDPLGVIRAYRLVRQVLPIQLVLAGGTATDDPEGQEILDEVLEAAEGDRDIHVLLLPPDAHHTVNALQRIADIILQKSTKEGFGLTVTEGLWKGKPVIGGDVGGIRLQVISHYTGYLVNSPEGAAHRIRFLLHHRDKYEEMGRTAREFVRENFLLNRHLREYLTLFLYLDRGKGNHLVL